MRAPAKALLQSRVVSTSETRTTPTNAGCHQAHPASNATATTTNPTAATAHSAPNTRMPRSPHVPVSAEQRGFVGQSLDVGQLQVHGGAHQVDEAVQGEHDCRDDDHSFGQSLCHSPIAIDGPCARLYSYTSTVETMASTLHTAQGMPSSHQVTATTGREAKGRLQHRPQPPHPLPAEVMVETLGRTEYPFPMLYRVYEHRSGPQRRRKGLCGLPGQHGDADPGTHS
jgi:hypothetical protein